MISINGKETSEEYGCIAVLKKMKPQLDLCFFLKYLL